MSTPKSELCPHCGHTRCYKHCYDAIDGVHEVDPTSASSVDGEDIAGNIVVDFNCKLCGQSGSLSVDPKEIAWN